MLTSSPASKNSTRAAVTILLFLAVCLAPCSKDLSGPEDDPPLIEILFPMAGIYDRDGDGLVDLEINFRDRSGVDPESLLIESSRALGPNGTGGKNLLASFAIIERDSLRIVLEETTQALLPTGSVELMVRIADGLGIVGEERLTLNLAAGEFHGLIETDGDVSAIGIEVLPDGSAGYLLSTPDIIQFDPLTFEVVRRIETGFFFDPVDGAFHAPTNKLFIVSLSVASVAVLDPVTQSITATFPISARSPAVTEAPTGDFLVALYAPFATVSIVDPFALRETRTIVTQLSNIDNPQEAAFIGEPYMVGNSDNIFLPLNIHPFGIGVFDDSGNMIDAIDLLPTSTATGLPVGTTLNPSTGVLYVGNRQGDRPLIAVNLLTQEILYAIISSSHLGRFPTLSPSSERIFLSLGSAGSGQAESWLIDAATGSILKRFPVAIFGENRAAFRPDGQVVFSVHDGDVAVYLNRE